MHSRILSVLLVTAVLAGCTLKSTYGPSPHAPGTFRGGLFFDREVDHFNRVKPGFHGQHRDIHEGHRGFHRRYPDFEDDPGLLEEHGEIHESHDTFHQLHDH